jgi:hypothetical protein
MKLPDNPTGIAAGGDLFLRPLAALSDNSL